MKTIEFSNLSTTHQEKFYEILSRKNFRYTKQGDDYVITFALPKPQHALTYNDFVPKSMNLSVLSDLSLEIEPEEITPTFNSSKVIFSRLQASLRTPEMSAKKLVEFSISVLNKEPQFGISVDSMERICQSPLAILDLFCQKEIIETQYFISELQQGSSEIQKSLYYFIIQNNIQQYTQFCLILNECFKNNGILEKLQLIQTLKTIFLDQNELRSIITYIGKLNIITNNAITTETLSSAFQSYFSNSELPLTSQITITPEPKLQKATKFVQKQAFILSEFNENLMLDYAQFIDFSAGIAIILPSICQNYAQYLLQAIPKPIPNALISKLREVISTLISSQIEQFRPDITFMKKKSTTVGEIFLLCKKLVQACSGEAVQMAKAMLISSGRVERESQLKD